jgi:hypothetical protein
MSLSNFYSVSVSPLCKGGLGGDLQSAVILDVFKSPSIPLYKGGSGGATPISMEAA